MVRLVRCGDDFTLSGRRSLCSTFRDVLGKHLLVKTTAVLGPNVEMGDVQEAIHLKRLARLYPPGAEGGERWEIGVYALAKSASRALGAVAVAADMAKVVKPRVRVDATASKAIASRRGVGQVRHLHTQVLWVQEAVARRELTIVKVTGIENPADMGTKHLAQKEIHEFRRRAGCRIVGGRSKLAFDIAQET